MKLFRESLIILGIYLLGELLASSLHLPVPGNILGMVILFILLCTKIVKVDNISTCNKFFIRSFSFLFYSSRSRTYGFNWNNKINMVAIINSLYINNNNYNWSNWTYCASYFKKNKIEKIKLC